MYCVIIFGDFPTEVTGPFKSKDDAIVWVRVNYGITDSCVVVRFRNPII